MPISLAESAALENEKRALQRELEQVENELRRLGGYGYSERTAPLQYRIRSIQARIHTIDVRLRQR